MKKIKSLYLVDPKVQLTQMRLQNIKEIFNKIGDRDITEDEQTQISTLLNDICDRDKRYSYLHLITTLCIIILTNDFSYDELKQLKHLLYNFLSAGGFGHSMVDAMLLSVIEIMGMMKTQRYIGVNGWRTYQIPKGTDRCLSYLKFQEDDCTD